MDVITKKSNKNLLIFCGIASVTIFVLVIVYINMKKTFVTQPQSRIYSQLDSLMVDALRCLK